MNNSPPKIYGKLRYSRESHSICQYQNAPSKQTLEEDAATVPNSCLQLSVYVWAHGPWCQTTPQAQCLSQKHSMKLTEAHIYHILHVAK